MVQAERKGNQPDGPIGKMGNLLEDQPDAKGKLEVAGGPMTERGSFGIVERAEDHLQIERFAALGNRGTQSSDCTAILGSHSR